MGPVVAVRALVAFLRLTLFLVSVKANEIFVALFTSRTHKPKT